MLAVDLFGDRAAGCARLTQYPLGFGNRRAGLVRVGGAPLHDLVAATIGDDDASHVGLLSWPEFLGRMRMSGSRPPRRGQPDHGRGIAGSPYLSVPGCHPLYSRHPPWARGTRDTL